MLALRLDEGAPTAWGAEPPAAPAIEWAIAFGLAERFDALEPRIRLTLRGRLLANELFARWSRFDGTCETTIRPTSASPSGAQVRRGRDHPPRPVGRDPGGSAARDFLARVDGLSAADRQQLMARLTGNYKRGNERHAGRHPRNG